MKSFIVFFQHLLITAPLNEKKMEEKIKIKTIDWTWIGNTSDMIQAYILIEGICNIQEPQRQSTVQLKKTQTNVTKYNNNYSVILLKL